MKKDERKDYLLNHKGKKFKTNTFIGLDWNFIRHK